MGFNRHLFHPSFLLLWETRFYKMQMANLLSTYLLNSAWFAEDLSLRGGRLVLFSSLELPIPPPLTPLRLCPSSFGGTNSN